MNQVTPPGPPRLLLRSDEAAAALAISPRKLWALTNAGMIPCIRLGRSVRYDPADLKAWVDRSKCLLNPSANVPDSP